MTNALKSVERDMQDLILKVSEIVTKESGNILEEDQYSMVINRITKRMMELGGLDVKSYMDYLNQNFDKEKTYLVSLLTTHHTFFFREFSHFEFLIAHMDVLVENAKKRGDNTIKVYSAACSKGQEVYSLAMLFKVHMLPRYPGMTFSIYGTDIDPQSVAYGENGVYPYNEVKSIPKMYLSGNWQRGTGDIARFARVKKDLKSFCSFGEGNLLNLSSSIRGMKFDVILCRNVLIYLKEEDTEKIVEDFKNYLYEDGYLITGLSESLKTLKNPPRGLAPSVYTFKTEDVAAENAVRPSAAVVAPAAQAIPSPIRMLCVDDSPAIIKLLTKIFEKDGDFEVVGTATNGLEAAEFLKNNKVDAMTLDIHMPEMDGVEYLKKHHHSGHPNVVVVSSASREDSRYALETLKHGALDFVEKPSLNNIGERADEIKMKIKMSFLQSQGDKGLSSVDKDFGKDFKIDDIDNKARLLVGSFSQISSMCKTVSELEGKQPPVFMLFEGNENYLDGIAEEARQKVKMNCHVWDEGVEVSSGQVYICDLKRDMPRLKDKFQQSPVSIGIYGSCSKKALASFVDFDTVQILVEDHPHLGQDLKDIASDIFPSSSFSHVGTEFLADPDRKRS